MFINYNYFNANTDVLHAWRKTWIDEKRYRSGTEKCAIHGRKHNPFAWAAFLSWRWSVRDVEHPGFFLKKEKNEEEL
jgi:hypothetical protein